MVPTIESPVAESSLSANTPSNSARLALSAKQLKIVSELLQQLLPNHQAWAFGSRVTGHARQYSDLDIAVSHPEPLSFDKICQLSSAFEDSELDICVDIIDWHRADPSFRQSVKQRDMVRLQ